MSGTRRRGAARVRRCCGLGASGGERQREPGLAVLGSREREGRKERERKEKERKRKGRKEKEKGKKKWRKEERKWKKKERERKGGGECAPAATAAAVGHARRRSRVRGPGRWGTCGACGQAALGCTQPAKRKDRNDKRNRVLERRKILGGY